MIRVKEIMPEVEWFSHFIPCFSSIPYVVEDRYKVKSKLMNWLWQNECQNKIINIETLPFEYGGHYYRVWYYETEMKFPISLCMIE